MTEEQIKQIEEKLETLRTMIKKAARNGNYPSVNCIKNKVEGINFMLNLLGCERPPAKAKGFFSEHYYSDFLLRRILHKSFH